MCVRVILRTIPDSLYFRLPRKEIHNFGGRDTHWTAPASVSAASWIGEVRRAMRLPWQSAQDECRQKSGRTNAVKWKLGFPQAEFLEREAWGERSELCWRGAGLELLARRARRRLPSRSFRALIRSVVWHLERCGTGFFCCRRRMRAGRGRACC